MTIICFVLVEPRLGVNKCETKQIYEIEYINIFKKQILVTYKSKSDLNLN